MSEHTVSEHPMLKVTDIRVIPVSGDPCLKAFVTANIGGLILRDLKVIDTPGRGLFVAMPQKKLKDGAYREIAYIPESEAKEAFEKAILDAYHDKLLEHERVAANSAHTQGEANDTDRAV